MFGIFGGVKPAKAAAAGAAFGAFGAALAALFFAAGFFAAGLAPAAGFLGHDFVPSLLGRTTFHQTPVAGVASRAIASPRHRPSWKTRVLRSAPESPARTRGEGTMAGLKERFGRPLRLGIIGGGPDAWIGRMHRGAAEMDGWWRAVAGVFSSDPARSRAAGVALGFDADRSYGTSRRCSPREKRAADGIDAVAIMTPNDTHYPFAAAALDAGLDVIGDKPVTHDFAQACDLVARAREERARCSRSRTATRRIR